MIPYRVSQPYLCDSEFYLGRLLKISMYFFFLFKNIFLIFFLFSFVHCVCGLSFFSLWFGIHVFKGSQVIPVCSQGFNPRAAETSRDLLCKHVGFMFLVKVRHETSACPHPDPAPSSPSSLHLFLSWRSRVTHGLCQ